jgi:hypothetical protein
MHSTAAWESQQVLIMTPTGFDISQLQQQDSDWLRSPLLLRIVFAEFIFVQLIFFLAGMAAPRLLNLKTPTHHEAAVACAPRTIHARPHPF